MSNSDSSVQRWAERRLIKHCEIVSGIQLNSSNLTLTSHTKVSLDGYSSKYSCAVEVYARIGDLAAAQQKKVAADILKLSLLPCKLKVYVAHPSVIKWMRGNSWIAYAVKHYKITLIEGYFTIAMTRKILSAQQRQRR